MMQGVTCRDWICISQLYRLEKKRLRKGEGREDLCFWRRGAEERTRLEISSWQPFLGRVIRIYL